MMSAATLAWADDAWASAVEQEVPPPGVGVVVDVVVVEVVGGDPEAQAAVAPWRLVPARAESASSWDWSETSAAWSGATVALEADDPVEPDGFVVGVVPEVAWGDVVVDDVVVVAVSLASALASVAWAVAREA